MLSLSLSLLLSLSLSLSLAFKTCTRAGFGILDWCGSVEIRDRGGVGWISGLGLVDGGFGSVDRWV